MRDEWGFDGIVITDWGGSNDHVKGVQAGSDLEMPNPGLDSARQLIKAVKEGRIKESTIDNSVDRMLEAVFELSQEREKIDDKGFKKHNDLAYRAAAESAVLLKNSDNILPLKPDTRVALIGDFAYVPRYQGSGSSVVNATSVEHMNMLINNTTLHVVGWQSRLMWLFTVSDSMNLVNLRVWTEIT